MTKYILVLIRLVCLLTVLNGYSQENQWLKGTWKGVYFGEKSKLTKTFDTRLQIVQSERFVVRGRSAMHTAQRYYYTIAYPHYGQNICPPHHDQIEGSNLL